MKYLCLAYYDERKFDAMADADRDALVRKCPPLDADLRATGQLAMVASLARTAASVAVRPVNGRPLVTDGPFAETKEQLGSFFLIEARDLNDAVRVACKHPAAVLGAEVGWGIEIRPIEYFDQP
ncbi:MAG: YciI family protein [Gammaproteobacteria bacterium]